MTSINSRDALLSERTKISAVTTVIFAGIALMSDGYNAQVVSYAKLVIEQLHPNAITSTLSTRLTNSYLIGEIVGMLGFGLTIDQLGRKTGVVLTTSLLILGIILSAAAHGKTATGMVWMLVVARGIAGVGAGGEYPVCSVSATEAANETAYVRKNRGLLLGMVGDFAIDSGFVLAGLVALIVFAAYGAVGSPTAQVNNMSDGMWRVLFGIGIVPPLLVFYVRMKMINSTAYRKSAMKKQRIPWGLVIKRYWRPMIGTTICWFLYDFVSYPFGLFSSTIISQLGPGATLIESIGYGTVINAFDLPGCILGAWSMDLIGRKNTMFYGFFIQGILGFIIGGALGPIQSVFSLFVVLYGIFVALGEFGPGVATILVANESYPTPIRGTLVGLSAAVGKAGAAIGTQVFTPIQNSFSNTEKGQQAVFLIGAGFGIAGALVTWFFVPEMSRELGGEDAAFKAYLEDNGWDTSSWGEALEDSAPQAVTKALEATGGFDSPSMEKDDE
ncbi:Major facilitator superfamily domain, general substrate transporter [Pseudohyphozyma bogoriensis]|nr:Major facilitator superfamily domain, general substrate transporter [Pseudohyphozyma bogoriensis]